MHKILYPLLLIFLFCSNLHSRDLKLSPYFVDVTTGSYCPVEQDLIVQGALPFVIERHWEVSDQDKCSTHFGWFIHIRPLSEQHDGLKIETQTNGELFKSAVVHGLSNQISYASVILEPGEYQTTTLKTHQGNSINYSHDGNFLQSVIYEDRSQITYEYDYHPKTRKPLITKRDEGNHRFLINEYYQFGENLLGDESVIIDSWSDFRIGKVKVQKAPVGKDETPIVVAKYFYESDRTLVKDAHNKEKIYHLTEDRTEITAIEESLESSEGIIKRFYQYFWQLSSTGKLLLTSESLKDELGQIHRCKTRQYNSSDQLIKETLWGNLSGQCSHALFLQPNGQPYENGIEHYSFFCSYLENAPHLIQEKWEDNGKAIEYVYDETNKILLSKRYKTNGKEIGCQTYQYNTDGILSGYKDEKFDANPHYIEAAFILSENPFTLGLPHLIEENGFDEDSGALNLIRTTYKQYTEKAELQKTRVFNGRGDCLQESGAVYDSSGRPLYICDSNGQGRHFIYDANGNVLVNSNEALGSFTSSEYDYANRLIRQNEQLVKEQMVSAAYQYNYLKQVTISEDEFGSQTQYLYDSWNRLKAIIYPSVLNENGDIDYPVIKYQYDYADNKTAIIDPKGYVTHIAYNVRNQPIEVVYPEGAVENMEYALDGRLIAFTSKNGLKTIYQYDENGQLIGEDDIAGFQAPSPMKSYNRNDWTSEAEEIHFEPFRNQHLSKKCRSNPNGTIEEITFDALGRPEMIIIYNQHGKIIAKQILRYDLVGNKVGQIDFAFVGDTINRQNWTCWTYGPGNRLEGMIEGFNGPEEKSTRYHYNSQGELVELVKPDGTSLLWDYDDAGRIVRFYASDFSFAYEYYYEHGTNIRAIENLQTHQFSIRNLNAEGKVVEELLQNNLQIKKELDNEGQISDLLLPDGSQVTYKYKEGRLASIERFNASKQSLYAYEYLNYDEKGRPLTAKLIGAVGIIEFKWDDEGHCISINSPYYAQELNIIDGCLKEQSVQSLLGEVSNRYNYDDLQQLIEESGLMNHSYEYDSILNRVVKNGTKATINTLNQTLSQGNAHYLYDKNGNLIEKREDQKTTLYRYDALNRLIEVSLNEGFQIKYSYDAFHRRMTRTCSVWNTQTKQWNLPSELRFIFDDNQEIGTVDTEGNIVELRILGNGLGAEIGAAVAIELQGVIYAPIHDHRGNVSCLVNAGTNQPVEYYFYSAYGEEVILDANGQKVEHSLVGNPWRFSSKRTDAETGLISYGRRDYDPTIGKWISPDPFGLVESPNRYSFLLNNPLLLVDFYGLFSVRAVWQNFKEAAAKWLYTASDLYSKAYTQIYTKIGQIGEFLLGKNLFLISGFYVEPPEYGTYGKGEIDPKLRLTFINGLFNLKHHFLYLIKLISESYGGNNVHYIYKGIEGWGRDMYKSLFIKFFGSISKDARQLATTWKKLINEMGGVKEGGLIIHFAHSIGGTETSRARTLMKPEELGMIRVITFGSPTMVSSEGFQDVVNIISCRDGVSMVFDPLRYFKTLMGNECNFDPLGYFKALMGIDCKVVMIGEFKRCFTCNFRDHNFVMYWDYWMSFENPDWANFHPHIDRV